MGLVDDWPHDRLYGPVVLPHPLPRICTFAAAALFYHARRHGVVQGVLESRLPIYELGDDDDLGLGWTDAFRRRLGGYWVTGKSMKGQYSCSSHHDALELPCSRREGLHRYFDGLGYHLALPVHIRGGLRNPKPHHSNRQWNPRSLV